jgi:hypothetical protein
LTSDSATSAHIPRARTLASSCCALPISNRRRP